AKSPILCSSSVSPSGLDGVMLIDLPCPCSISNSTSISNLKLTNNQLLPYQVDASTSASTLDISLTSSISKVKKNKSLQGTSESISKGISKPKHSKSSKSILSYFKKITKSKQEKVEDLIEIVWDGNNSQEKSPSPEPLEDSSRGYYINNLHEDQNNSAEKFKSSDSNLCPIPFKDILENVGYPVAQKNGNNSLEPTPSSIDPDVDSDFHSISNCNDQLKMAKQLPSSYLQNETNKYHQCTTQGNIMKYNSSFQPTTNTPFFRNDKTENPNSSDKCHSNSNSCISILHNPWQPMLKSKSITRRSTFQNQNYPHSLDKFLLCSDKTHHSVSTTFDVIPHESNLVRQKISSLPSRKNDNSREDFLDASSPTSNIIPKFSFLKLPNKAFTTAQNDLQSSLLQQTSCVKYGNSINKRFCSKEENDQPTQNEMHKSNLFYRYWRVNEIQYNNVSHARSAGPFDFPIAKRFSFLGSQERNTFMSLDNFHENLCTDFHPISSVYKILSSIFIRRIDYLPSARSNHNALDLLPVAYSKSISIFPFDELTHGDTSVNPSSILIPEPVYSYPLRLFNYKSLSMCNTLCSLPECNRTSHLENITPIMERPSISNFCRKTRTRNSMSSVKREAEAVESKRNMVEGERRKFLNTSVITKLNSDSKRISSNSVLKFFRPKYVLERGEGGINPKARRRDMEKFNDKEKVMKKVELIRHESTTNKRGNNGERCSGMYGDVLNSLNKKEKDIDEKEYHQREDRKITTTLQLPFANQNQVSVEKTISVNLHQINVEKSCVERRNIAEGGAYWSIVANPDRMNIGNEERGVEQMMTQYSKMGKNATGKGEVMESDKEKGGVVERVGVPLDGLEEKGDLQEMIEPRLYKTIIDRENNRNPPFYDDEGGLLGIERKKGSVEATIRVKPNIMNGDFDEGGVNNSQMIDQRAAMETDVGKGGVKNMDMQMDYYKGEDDEGRVEVLMEEGGVVERYKFDLDISRLEDEEGGVELFMDLDINQVENILKQGGVKEKGRVVNRKLDIMELEDDEGGVLKIDKMIDLRFDHVRKGGVKEKRGVAQGTKLKLHKMEIPIHIDQDKEEEDVIGEGDGKGGVDEKHAEMPKGGVTGKNNGKGGVNGKKPITCIKVGNRKEIKEGGVMREEDEKGGVVLKRKDIEEGGVMGALPEKMNSKNKSLKSFNIHGDKR
ncbi:hypothetical protein ROZALSC1DRAFT_24179, partial [Rozella allomycis CSF55]